MPSLLDILDAACREVFTAMGYPAQIAGVQESTRGDAPFQCNGAMGAAGIAKKRGEKLNPRDIAAEAIEALKSHAMIEKMDIGGPGFINIYPSQTAISQRAEQLTQDGNLGIEQPEPLSIIVDYGGANVAKPMHVGHLRSAVIGEARGSTPKPAMRPNPIRTVWSARAWQRQSFKLAVPVIWLCWGISLMSLLRR